MSISDEQYSQWLRDDQARRCVLIELDHSDGTVYVASNPFISESDDSDPNRLYDDALLRTVGIQSRIDRSASIGAIEVADDGEKVLGTSGYWATLKWSGFGVRFYLGDSFWRRDDFRLIVSGVNGGLQSSNKGRAVFRIIDNKSDLAGPLQVDVLPNGKTMPIALGRPFNVPPGVYDDPTHDYQVNEGVVSSVTVKANGVVAPHTPNYANGRFTLGAYPQENITVDIDEVHSTPSQIIQWVCDRYGVAFDAASLAVLPAYAFGLFIDRESSGDKVLDAVCRSLGGYWRRNLLGEVEVYQMLEPAAVADLTLTEDDIAEDGLNLIRTEDPAKKVTVRYKKNFSPTDRDSLAGIALSDPVLVSEMTTEWREVTVTNVVSNDQLPGDRVIDTYLVHEADAQAEAARIAAIRAVRREIWSVDCFVTAAQVLVGQTIEVFYPRHGFDGGRRGRVHSVSKSPTEDKVKLEVWF